MRIRTSLALMVATTVVVAGMFWWAFERIVDANQVAFRRVDAAFKITRGVFELNLLTNDYLLHKEERAREQWIIRHESLEEAFRRHEGVFENGETRSVLAEIRMLVGDLKTIFVKLPLETEPKGITAAREAKLVNLLLVKSQRVADFSFQLIIQSERQARAVLARSEAFIGLVIVFGLVLGTGFAFALYVKVVTPLKRLQHGAQMITKGNFHYRIRSTQRDELGELSEAFDAMVAQLAKLTERLQQERSREQFARAKDEALLASLGEGVLATGKHGNLVLINKAASEMLGWEAKDCLGKSVFAFVPMQRKDGTEVSVQERPLHRALGEGESTVSDIINCYYFVRKNDTRFPVVVVVTPIHFNEQIIGAAVVFRDATQELEVSRAKSNFVSLASHQLRTPLASMNWYAEMLVSGEVGELNKKQKQYAGEIYEQGRRMAELINALLNVSRIEAGSVAITPEPTDITAVCDLVVRDFRSEIREKNLVLETNYERNLPRVVIDPELFRIVVQNLISNAVKYTEVEGTVSVSITKVDDHVVLAVSDTGIGIPQSEQSKVFSKLFRAENAVAAGIEGTGLGLYVARWIVDHCGGRIRFESEEGAGSTFYVTLPVHDGKPKKGSKRLVQEV